MQLVHSAYWTPLRTAAIRTTPGKEKSGITRFARPYGHLYRFPLALRFADRGRAVWGLAEPTPETSGARKTERRVKANAPLNSAKSPRPITIMVALDVSNEQELGGFRVFSMWLGLGDGMGQFTGQTRGGTKWK